MIIEKIIQTKTATLIDIRNEGELAETGQLDCALHIPLHTLPDCVAQIREMSRPIILFCAAGGRASRAIEFLSEQGIDELYNGGGYNDIKKYFE